MTRDRRLGIAKKPAGVIDKKQVTAGRESLNDWSDVYRMENRPQQQDTPRRPPPGSGLKADGSRAAPMSPSRDVEPHQKRSIGGRSKVRLLASLGRSQTIPHGRSAPRRARTPVTCFCLPSREPRWTGWLHMASDCGRASLEGRPDDALRAQGKLPEAVAGFCTLIRRFRLSPPAYFLSRA
jgi:hypothetical protein